MTIQENTVYGGKIAGWKTHAPATIPGFDGECQYFTTKKEAVAFAKTLPSKYSVVVVSPTERFLPGTIIHAPGWGPEFAK